MVIFIMSIGFKNTFKTLYRYPTLVILPIFSCWTFGPSGKLSGCSLNQENKIILSIKHTWINFGLSLIMSLILITLADFQRNNIDVKIFFVIFGYISGAFLMCVCFTSMPKFLKPFCCNKFIDSRQAVIKLTAFDPSKPDLLIDFPEQTNDSEMNSTEQSTL